MSLFNNASAQLNYASAQLNYASAQLNYASAQLNNASAQLNYASAQLNYASTQLNNASAQTGNVESLFNQICDQCKSSEPAKREAPLPAQIAQVNRRSGTHTAGKSKQNIRIVNINHKWTVMAH